MFGLDSGLGRERPLRLVLLGAHADDIEIGAGGTLLRLLAERPQTHVVYTVLTASGDRADEARAAAQDLLADAAGLDVHTPGFRDGFLPYQAETVKVWARETLGQAAPDLVLTHRSDDGHQDHRFVAHLAWQTFRGAAIASYEIPKWDGDLDRPNAYVTLDEPTVDRKLALLSRHFQSQQGKGWYDGETFRGLARIRGVESGARYAEAFHCRKLVW